MRHILRPGIISACQHLHSYVTLFLVVIIANSETDHTQQLWVCHKGKSLLSIEGKKNDNVESHPLCHKCNAKKHNAIV